MQSMRDPHGTFWHTAIGRFGGTERVSRAGFLLLLAFALVEACGADDAVTIAHLQHIADDRSDELRMRLSALRRGLIHARHLVDQYALILTGGPPIELDHATFTKGFSAELDRLLKDPPHPEAG